MTTSWTMKIWKLVFLFLGLLVSTSEEKHIYGNTDNKGVSENDSNLYFNGGEDETSNKFTITEEDLPKDGELFEGDMVMDSTLRRRVLGFEQKKAAVVESESGNRKHWPRGVVPYVIDESTLKEIRRQIPRAIKFFKRYTCIKYRPYNPRTDPDYVVFKLGKGCSSSVGRQGGMQTIHFAHGCRRIGTIMHEMMHTIGIVHEQSRPDRDRYIEVKFANIKHKLRRNFMKYNSERADTLGQPYNYYSVMHYSNYAFSKNDEETLVAKFDENLKFGQRQMLSKGDVKQINTLYPCTKVYDDTELHSDMTEEIIKERRRDNLIHGWRSAMEDLFDKRFYKK